MRKSSWCLGLSDAKSVTSFLFTLTSFFLVILSFSLPCLYHRILST
jgi:hypothetical protein